LVGFTVTCASKPNTRRKNCHNCRQKAVKVGRLFSFIKQYKHILTVLGFTIVSHGLGFGREISIAYLYGASSISDGLLIGLAPLTLFLGIFGVGYANVSMTRIKSPDNHEVIDKTLYPVIIAAVVIAVVFFFGAELIISLTGPGLAGEGLDLAVSMVQLSTLASGMAFLYYWFRGLRYLEKNFLRASIADLMPNLGILLGIFALYSVLGVMGIAIGITLGYFFQLVFVFDHRRLNFKRFRLADLWCDDLKIIYKNTFYTALGISGVIVDLFVDRYFASTIAEGAVASINFSYKVMSLPVYTVVVAIVTVMYPRLIGLRDDVVQFNRLKVKTNLLLLGFGLVNTVVFMYFSTQIITLLFNYGEFGKEDVASTAPLLSIYAAGLIFHGYVLFNTRVRFALEDFKTPLYAGMCGATTNVVLDFLLVDPYGTSGLAIATTVAASVNAGILLFVKQPLSQSSKPVANEPLNGISGK
jgi:putative peptidoglycan lipid II flippase